MESRPATNGDATAAPETPPRDQGERGSSVPEMTCIPIENDQTCGEEESALGSKLPSSPSENLVGDQADEGNSCAAFQSVGSISIAPETMPRCGDNGCPNPAMADDQVPSLDHHIPLQRGSETEQQNVCLPALEDAVMEGRALNFDASSVIQPMATTDQSTPVHESQSCISTDRDSIVFGVEVIKETNRPESGQPSRQHNAIPWTEILRSTIEGTLSDADTSLEAISVGVVNKDISVSGEIQAATSDGIVRDLTARNGVGGRAFENIDSEYLQSILVKNSGRPKSGDPSKGHN